MNTITRSPAWRTSSLCGKTALPSRTIAPITAPLIGISRNREADVLARRARRDVEHLEAVALDHRDLLRAGIVGEAHDLLGRHLARIHRHVDSRVLVDLPGDRVVDDRDREVDAVDACQRRRVVVLRVLAHREHGRLRLADALALEELRVEAGRLVDPGRRELLGDPARPLAVRLDQPDADALLEQLTRDRDADLAAAEDDDVLDDALAGSEELRPRPARPPASRRRRAGLRR